MKGKIFGRLTVMEYYGNNKKGAAMWKCICDCNKECIVRGADLRIGHTKSCGCLDSELTGARNTTHGLRWHPLYGRWNNIVSRCYNPKDKNYINYGGRGIKVCDRWRYSIKNFIEDLFKSYTEGLELDRIDNDGDYEPSNVRWVTGCQNNLNKRGHLKSSSKYKGVCWDKRTNKWMVRICKDGVTRNLGRFIKEEDAAEAYNIAALELFGEYSYLNKIKVCTASQ